MPVLVPTRTSLAASFHISFPAFIFAPCIVLLIVLLCCRPADALCYGVTECACETTSHGVNIDCRNHGLNAVPRFSGALAPVHYELNLAGNLIANLSTNTFPDTLTFERIVLTDNPLYLVANDAFRGQEGTLRELLLSLAPDVQIPSTAIAVLSRLVLLEIQVYERLGQGAWGLASLPPRALINMSNLEDLTLSGSALQFLSQADLAAQVRLVNLSLKSNQLTQVPIAFMTPVGNLSRLDLASNKISQVQSGQFSGVTNLRALDLSYNPIHLLDRSAFVGLEERLGWLSCAYCHLPDSSLYALQGLKALTELRIPGNGITSVDDALASSRGLKVLDVQSNKITTLNKATYKQMANSLEVLDLSHNPLTSIPSDIFSALRSLRDLQLNEMGLMLPPALFSAQHSSLRSLSLKGTNFTAGAGASAWSWIQNLSALESLVVSSCGIQSVPDFTFQQNNHLANIDLTGNLLTVLTQRSLAGLEFSLNRLVLNKNNLRTLDDCIFHQFTQIDLLKVGLNNNPLACDCSMRWLYDRLQQVLVPVLWSCADGSIFRSLPPETFATCPMVAPNCESLLPTTVPTPSNGVLVAVDGVGASSIAVTWVVGADVNATAVSVTWQTGADDASVVAVAPSDSRYEITGLAPNTAYVVCILVTMTTSLRDVHACVDAQTGIVSSLSTQEIIGISVGASIALLLIVAAIVVLVIRTSRRRATQQLASPPMRGGHTKRFIKHTDDEAGEVLAGDDSRNGFISHTLDLMTDEEKSRLVNLLTNSSSSLHDLDRSDSRYKSRAGKTQQGDRGVKYQPSFMTEQSMTDKHVYEEIPDSHYEKSAKCFEEHEV